MFEDLSIHYIRLGKHKWTLEQSVSQISKVEIFDKSTIPTSGQDGTTFNRLTYLRQMNEEMTIAEVPFRIVQRYVENIKFFAQTVIALFQQQDLTSIKVYD